MWPVRWLARAATKWTMTLGRCCILLLLLFDCLLVALNCTRVDRNLPLEIAFVCLFVCLFFCLFVLVQLFFCVRLIVCWLFWIAPKRTLDRMCPWRLHFKKVQLSAEQSKCCYNTGNCYWWWGWAETRSQDFKQFCWAIHLNPSAVATTPSIAADDEEDGNGEDEFEFAF